MRLRLENVPGGYDKTGAWFNSALVDAAAAMFRVFAQRTARREEPAKYRDAADAREHWAREQGCADFTQAMAIGLQHVGRGALSAHASSAQQQLAKQAAEILPPKDADPQYAEWAASL